MSTTETGSGTGAGPGTVPASAQPKRESGLEPGLGSSFGSGELSPFTATGSLRRAKIVATLGPASNTEATFRALVRAGLDVARLNFSHGTQADKQLLIDMIRKVSAEEAKPICILADLQGPKIRTGKLVDRTPVLLEAGQTLTITPRDELGTRDRITTTFVTLAENLESGARILLSDGLIELHVIRIVGDEIECAVINGGLLGENKGINLPGIAAKVPSLTEKDAADLEFAIGAGVDAVALSFVRNASDVQLVKDRIVAAGADTWIIAKLEKPQAVENVDEILEIADGVMVARGDLGVEVPPEKVPAMQKLIIRRAAEYRKPVITATQMLESMVENPRPTRAEASDVANAVYDGTDAVMLSAESAAGKYPVEAVKMMAKIVLETEEQMRELPSLYPSRAPGHATTVAESICESMAHASNDLDIRAIAVFTETGSTARLLSKRMPKPPICALSSSETVLRRMSLLRGVYPLACDKSATTEHMIETVEDAIERSHFARRGDVVGIVAGTRTNSGSTNFMRMHVLGDLVEPPAPAPSAHAAPSRLTQEPVGAPR